MATIEMKIYEFVAFDFPALFVQAENVRFRRFMNEADEDIRIFSPHRKLVAYEDEQFGIEGIEVSAEMLPVNVVQLRVRILFTPKTELEQTLLEDLNTGSRDNIQRYLIEFRELLFRYFIRLLSEYMNDVNVLNGDQVTQMFDDTSVLLAHGELLQETQPRICSDSYRLLRNKPSKRYRLRMI